MSRLGAQREVCLYLFSCVALLAKFYLLCVLAFPSAKGNEEGASVRAFGEIKPAPWCLVSPWLALGMGVNNVPVSTCPLFAYPCHAFKAIQSLCLTESNPVISPWVAE